MGAPISSVVAQLVLEDLEENVIPKLKTNLPFYKRYVDDCITALPLPDLDNILKEFNSYHPRLQFTAETETNKQINFLDITLIRKGINIKTKWFKKSTSSSRYLHYNSIQPHCHKKTVVVNLIDRAIKLSSPEFRKESLNTIKQLLLENK